MKHTTSLTDYDRYTNTEVALEHLKQVALDLTTERLRIKSKAAQHQTQPAIELEFEKGHARANNSLRRYEKQLEDLRKENKDLKERSAAQGKELQRLKMELEEVERGLTAAMNGGEDVPVQGGKR